MAGGVHLTQAIDGHPGVDLGGRGRTVTQQLLHGPDIRPAVEQMSGEGVSQRVRRDPAGQSGWSVTAVGPSSEVTDPGELARLRTIGLRSWAPGERDHFIRISPVMLNGRRLCAGGAQLTQQSG